MCTYEPGTTFAPLTPLVTMGLLSFELDAGVVKLSLATCCCQFGELGELEERIDVVAPALNPFGEDGPGC